jgi:hypothetical protein
MVGDAVAHIVITGLPTTRGSAIPVGVGDKVYCEITEDASGVATSALIDVDVSWPASVAPQLIGGNEPVGAVGKRIVQLCEVVADGDNVKLNILHTGHIDQFQPSLLDNTASSGGGAGVLQKFEPTTGKWMLRRIVAGTGVTVTENTNSISIARNAASGIWGTFFWTFADELSSFTSTLELTFENGILTAAAGDGTGDGTEASPYNLQFESYNQDA